MLGELRLLSLGEPQGGDWGNPAGPQIVPGFKKLYKNPLGKPSWGIFEKEICYVINSEIN